jgi:hypothetical protein
MVWTNGSNTERKSAATASQDFEGTANPLVRGDMALKRAKAKKGRFPRLSTRKPALK